MAYIYRHIRLDKNEPFYIGISNVKNRKGHKKGRNDIWTKIVSKTEYEIEILPLDLSWEEACLKETEFIKLYGRINNKTGILANMTDGGEGTHGLIHRKKALEKISKSSRGRVGYWLGKKMPDGYGAKLSAIKLVFLIR